MRDGGDGSIYALIAWKLTRCIDIIADYTSKICTPVIARAREAQHYDERDNLDFLADGHITIIRKFERALQALGHSRSYLLKITTIMGCVCTAPMTPPAQPKKCAASSNGSLGSFSAALYRNHPIGNLGSHRYKT